MKCIHGVLLGLLVLVVVMLTVFSIGITWLLNGLMVLINAGTGLVIGALCLVIISVPYGVYRLLDRVVDAALDLENRDHEQ